MCRGEWGRAEQNKWHDDKEQLHVKAGLSCKYSL